MFGNLGVHVIRNPKGTFSYVGTIPSVLGVMVPATTADVMAGRSHQNPHTGELYAIKFPIFPTAEEAVAFAAEHGVAVKGVSK